MAAPGNPALMPACPARGSPPPQNRPKTGSSGSGDRDACAFRLRRGPRAAAGSAFKEGIRRGPQPALAALDRSLRGRAPVRKRESSPDHAEAQIGAARPALRWGNGLGRTPIRPEPGISCSDTAHSSKFDPRGSAKKRTTGIACSEQAAWRLGAGLKKASGGGR
jgi:hypothetical protein